MVPRISVEQYHKMPEYTPAGKRTELIRGIVIEKMSKSPLHASLLRFLFQIVQAAVAGTGWIVFKEDPITLADSEPEPDVSVVEGGGAGYKRAHPGTARLVIEVAVTTVELDRAKVLIYAEANIPECWLVLGKKKTVEVYTEPREGRYTQHRTFTGAASVVSTTVPGLRVELETLFSD